MLNFQKNLSEGCYYEKKIFIYTYVDDNDIFRK